MKLIRRRIQNLVKKIEREPTLEELESSLLHVISEGQEGTELPPECVLCLNNHSDLSTVKKLSDNELTVFICSSIETLIEEIPV